ncbi:MAG: ABC transporter permease subunit [Roseiarcus sp.]
MRVAIPGPSVDQLLYFILQAPARRRLFVTRVDGRAGAASKAVSRPGAPARTRLFRVTRRPGRPDGHAPRRARDVRLRAWRDQSASGYWAGVREAMVKSAQRFLASHLALVGLIVLVIATSIASPAFLQIGNLLNILRQTSVNAVMATGMTFVIVTAGIDLSVGALLAFTGAVAAALVAAGFGLGVTLFLTLLLGAGLGALSGLAVVAGGVQPFIATLVSMTVLRGATLVFTNGTPIDTSGGPASEAFFNLGAGYVLGVPIPVIVTAVVYGASWFAFTRLRFGRYVYVIGGNQEVARLAGVHVGTIKVAVYALSGMLAAVAGIIITSRLESAQPTAGTGYELDAIAAVVLGGTSLAGGKGSLFGTLVGALIIGVLSNAFNLMDVSSYYQMIAKGAVILLAVLADMRGKSAT